MGTKCHKYIQSDAHRLTDISTVPWLPWPFGDDTWLLTRPIFGSQHPRVFSAGFVAEPRKPRNIRVVAVQLALVHIVPWIFKMGL